MPSDAQLLPNGQIVLVNQGGDAAEDLPRKLKYAFQKSTVAGLMALGTDALEESLPPVLHHWRSFVREYLCEICQSPPLEVERNPETPLPGNNTLREFVHQAPPGPGMEYLSTELVANLWRDLDRFVAAESAKTEGGLSAWLAKRHPSWRLVGKVTFHLAENKNNDEFPFAFLATYTHRVSADSRLQHLPLGKAIRDYAGKKNARVLRSLLAPVQAAAKRSAFIRELVDSKKVFRVQAWTPQEALGFVKATSDCEEAGLIVKVPDWWKGGRPSRPTLRVELDDTGRKTSVGLDSLLTFNVHTALDGERLTESEWESLMNGSDGLVSIKGKWVEVDREKMRQMLDQWKRAQTAAGEGLSFLQGMRMLAGFPVGGPGYKALNEAMANHIDLIEIKAGNHLETLLKKISDPGQNKAVRLGRSLRAQLRPYQQEGLNWLWLMHRLGLGACLADDMGLGKTIQVIALLLQIRKDARKKISGSEKQPVLLVVPASLLGNWKAECERFAPSLEVFYAHPSQSMRERLAFLETAPAENSDPLTNYDAVITTYSMIKRYTLLQKSHWSLVVLDEAQAIKNPGAGQSRTVKALSSRTRLILTGTPIENSVADLWSLFDFINPGLLGSARRFREATSKLAQSVGYAPLRRLVSPYILRRLKTDRSVIADLPDKTEVRAFCGLTKTQAKLYKQSVSQLAVDLKRKDLEAFERSGLVLTYLMRLKQICNHPALWTGSGDFDLPRSGKLKRLETIAGEVSERGEKMLVFSQYREMTAPLAEFLTGIFGRPGLILHGGTAVKRRQQLVEQFQDPVGPPFFVISLKAGGTGLNLTAASHVVHFDRWWNPAVENQATDRAYRIGQKRNVLVHKFVCRGTVEEKIDRLIEDKKEVANEIIGKKESGEKILTSMDNDELLDFVSIDIESAVF